jgi:extradiol dioxygenase family protein
MQPESAPGSLAEFSLRPMLQLVLPVADLEASRRFYQDLLGCRAVRANTSWIEFDFFGNRLIACRLGRSVPAAFSANVAGSELPVPHFGLVLGWDDWHRAVDHLNYVGARFQIAPAISFTDTEQEQGLFALRDPDDNLVVFRVFRHPEAAYRADH